MPVLSLEGDNEAARVHFIDSRRCRSIPRTGLVAERRHTITGGRLMTTLIYNRQLTALLVIDPYNDFISEGGKLWDRVRAVAEANGCVPNMLQVLNAARKAGLRVFYAMHHRYRPGDYETWKYVAPVQRAAWRR